MALRGNQVRLLSVIVALAFGLLAVFELFSGSSDRTDTTDQTGVPDETPAVGRTVALAAHDIILIDGNAGFTAANGVVGGSGTLTDPYLMENWDINASVGIGIEIRNTNAYFVIRSCYIHDGQFDGSFYEGIRMYFCENGTLDGNTLSNNSYGVSLTVADNITMIENICTANDYGFFLELTYNSTLRNNTCSSSHYDGIYVQSSAYNDVEDNNCTLNLQHGIGLLAANNITIEANNCSQNAKWGIYLDYSFNNTLVRNNCSSNEYDGFMLNTYSDNNTLVSNIAHWNVFNGVDVVNSRDNLLVSNNWSDNHYDGVYVGYSSNVTLDSNNVCMNDRYGIQLGYSENVTMFRNQICYNAQYGMGFFTGSSNNAAFNNTFIGNNGAGSVYDSAHIQAVDDGSHNRWNNTYGYGNYWSDWLSPDIAPPYGIVDVPYTIAGTAAAVDSFPLTAAVAPIPEFPVFPVTVGTLLIAFLLIAGAGRRRVE